MRPRIPRHLYPSRLQKWRPLSPAVVLRSLPAPRPRPRAPRCVLQRSNAFARAIVRRQRAARVCAQLPPAWGPKGGLIHSWIACIAPLIPCALHNTHTPLPQPVARPFVGRSATKVVASMRQSAFSGHASAFKVAAPKGMRAASRRSAVVTKAKVCFPDCGCDCASLPRARGRGSRERRTERETWAISSIRIHSSCAFVELAPLTTQQPRRPARHPPTTTKKNPKKSSATASPSSSSTRRPTPSCARS